MDTLSVTVRSKKKKKVSQSVHMSQFVDKMWRVEHKSQSVHMTQFVDKMWHVAQIHLASVPLSLVVIRQNQSAAAELRKGEVHRYTGK